MKCKDCGEAIGHVLHICNPFTREKYQNENPNKSSTGDTDD